MKKKYSKNFERDWEFYTKNSDKFNFPGKNISLPKYDINGKNAKDCFYIIDTHGKYEPTAEPELLLKILTTKAAINLHIKLWAEGRLDGTFLKGDVDDLTNKYAFPEWIITAVNRQWVKLWKENNEQTR